MVPYSIIFTMKFDKNINFSVSAFTFPFYFIILKFPTHMAGESDLYGLLIQRLMVALFGC